MLAAVPPLAVAVQYVNLQAYSPAVTLLLLGLAVALSPFAPPRPHSRSWRPDALGLVLGLSLAAQGIDLLARPQPEIIPYGLYYELAVVFLVFGRGRRRLPPQPRSSRPGSAGRSMRSPGQACSSSG